MMCAHCMQLHRWEQRHAAGQDSSWGTPGDALEKAASQHSRVLTEAAAIAMTNYCPFRVRCYNDGKRSITYELLEVAVQNSWAAEDFIGTDRVKEEAIFPHEGIERGSFLRCKESLTFPGAALHKNVLCFRPLCFQVFYWNHFHSFQQCFLWIWGSSLHKVISTRAMWGKGWNQKIWLYSLQVQQPRF